MSTTWYAQNGSPANVSAWSGSASTVWYSTASGTGGSFMPGASFAAAIGAGDVLCANNKSTLTLDVNFTCLCISTAAEVPIQGGSTGSAGGGFTVSANIHITANVLAGSTACITMASGTYTLTITGSVTGGSATSAYGIGNTSSATASMVVNGNVSGGNGVVAVGMYMTAATSYTVIGNVLGGGGNSAYGIYAGSGGCVGSVTGNVTGGSSAAAGGLYNSTNAAITVTGAVIGGSVVNTPGIVFGGGSGVCSITGSVSASPTAGTYGVQGATNLTVTSGNIINTIYANAIDGAVKYNPGPGNYIEYPKTPSGVVDLGAGTVVRPVSGQIFPRGV